MREMTDPTGARRLWRGAGETGPPVDLYETADAVIVRLAIPGAEGSSLSLTIEDDRCVVRGECSAPGNRWGERTLVHWQEIPYGRFERRIPLPTVVVQEASRASFRHGVLEIVLPKKSRRASETIQIPIR